VSHYGHVYYEDCFEYVTMSITILLLKPCCQGLDWLWFCSSISVSLKKLKKNIYDTPDEKHQ